VRATHSSDSVVAALPLAAAVTLPAPRFLMLKNIVMGLSQARPHFGLNIQKYIK
jgi:hypothetical protein